MFTPVLILISVLLIWLLYGRWQKYSKMPPGPMPWPIIGNIPLFAGGRKSWDVFLDVARQYGDITTVWLGFHRPVVLLSSMEHIRAALVDNQHDFASRPDMVINKKFMRGSEGIIFGKNNSKWQALKKLLMSALRRIVDQSALCDGVNDAVQEVVQQLASVKESVNVQPYLYNIVYNVITQFVFAKRYALDDPEFLNAIEYSKKGNVEFAYVIKLEAVIPYAASIPNWFWKAAPFHRKLNFTFQQQLNFLGKHIKEHRETFHEGQVHDILDAILQEQLEQLKAGDSSMVHLDDTTLKIVLLELYLAGTDTTSSTLSWFFLHMVMNPDIQEKCYRQIVDVLGPTGQPALSHRNSMPYVEACILETLRITNITPGGVPHCTAVDANLGGYHIPANTTVSLNIHAVHRNPKLWAKPNTFDPMHFLDAAGTVIKPQQFISFGVGRRTCAGEMLAKNNLFLIAVGLLQKLKFTKVPGKKYTLEPNPEQDLLMLPSDYDVHIEQR